MSDKPKQNPALNAQTRSNRVIMMLLAVIIVLLIGLIGSMAIVINLTVREQQIESLNMTRTAIVNANATTEQQLTETRTAKHTQNAVTFDAVMANMSGTALSITRTAIAQMNATAMMDATTFAQRTSTAAVFETSTAVFRGTDTARLVATDIAQATANMQRAETLAAVTQTAVQMNSFATQTAIYEGSMMTQTAIAELLTPHTATPQPCFFVWHVPSREQDTETLPALLDEAGIAYDDAYTEIFWGEDEICGDEVREAIVMRLEYHVRLTADARLMGDAIQMGDIIADIIPVLADLNPNSPAAIHITFEQGETQQTWKLRYENAITNYQYGLRGADLFNTAP